MRLLVGLFVLTSVLAQSAFAQDEVQTVQTEGTSKAVTSFDAENAIKQNAKNQVARDQIAQLLGEKRYQKNKNLIESRIVREADRFIPMISGGKIEKVGDVWKMPVTVKVSLSNLRQMIVDNGFLMDAEGPATILPMIEISDRVRGQQYRWWMGETDEKKTLSPINQNLQGALFKELDRVGFYMIRPQTALLASIVPDAYRNDRFQPEDLRFWGEFYNAQIILRGDIRVRESSEVSRGFQIAIKLAAVQVANARTVAEVTRTFETDAGSQDAVVRGKLQTAVPEVAKDLGAQIVEAWQKGTLGSTRMRLSIRGRLGPKQLTDFKSQISRSVVEIKGVRERLMEPGQVTFEVDYAGNAQQLSEKIKTLNMPGFAVKLSSASENLITLDVKPL